MTLSRRKTLALIGGGTILAAGAAAGGFLGTRTPQTALAPWDAAGNYDDPREWALSYAILAPNAHNRQPWLVGLEGNDTVTLWRDKTRELPETDPFQRQLVISLGCFIEQMRIAATHRQIDVRLDIYPEGEDGPAAIATFGGTATPDPLFAAVPHRRSCKQPFEDRPVDAKAAQDLGAYANILTDPDMVGKLKQLTWNAWLTEAHYPPTWTESVDLMRFGKAEINANPDGIDLGGAFLESLMLLGLLSRDDQAKIGSAGFKQGVAIYHEMMDATPAYAVVTTRGNSRQDQIEAGRRWLRLNLAATALGVSLHPVSQALQEYPQMAEHYDAAHQLMAEPGETVQMLGRLGYGPAIAPTPRWPLETRFI
ncbi:Acg family FMN-binding oxidoreductase [Aliiroseovarius sp. YM-037]|uniref:Acg family FMN-binding oxidoreductase n=1 Tax=Aliiroseovarius sp. YM-037 TaxID=3341728 RepID=UPI003A81107C